MSEILIPGKTEVLPDSRARDPKGLIFSPMGWMVPIFCANCGCEGGLVPQENTTFAFWQCTPCSEKYPAIAGTVAIPDEVFWERVKLEQLERYGRTLSAEETVAALADPESLESKLARDRRALTPKAG